MSNHRFSRNGKLPDNPTPPTSKPGHTDQDDSRYVKNEIDIRLDKLNELWQAMEGKLLGMQPPRQICCHYFDHHDEDDDVVERLFLGIQRHGSKWRVCHAIVPGSTKEPEAKDWKPITDCSIEIRVKAADHVHRLEYHVTQTGKRFIPDLDRAITKLEKAILGQDDDDE